METAAARRTEGGFVRERLVPALVLASVMALLAGELFTWPESASDPAGLPFLAALYLAYAATLQALVARFRWSAGQAMLFGALAGVLLEGFFHRAFFADPPRVLGVNWLTVAVMALYWGVLTTGLAYYAARRAVSLSTQPPRTAAAWVGLAVWWVTILGVWAANLPPLREAGAIPIAALAAALFAGLTFWTRRTLRPVPRRAGTIADVEPSRALDAAICAYIVVQVLAALAVPPLGVRVAIWIFTGVALGVLGLLVLPRLVKSEDRPGENAGP